MNLKKPNSAIPSRPLTLQKNNQLLIIKCLLFISIDIVDKLFGLKEKQDAKQRQIRKPESVKANLPEQNKAQSRDKLGIKAKVSGRTYEKGIKIKTSPYY